jgi:hypothetical protein
LYGGSHPVPDAADWDGDGRTDLIVGNADGCVRSIQSGLRSGLGLGLGEVDPVWVRVRVRSILSWVRVRVRVRLIQSWCTPAEEPQAVWFRRRVGIRVHSDAPRSADGSLCGACLCCRRVLFLRNVGSNAEPRFLPGVPLKSHGVEIHVQPGYESLRGCHTALCLR